MTILPRLPVCLEINDHDLALGIDHNLIRGQSEVIFKDETTLPGSFRLSLTPDEARTIAAHLTELASQADALND